MQSQASTPPTAPTPPTESPVESDTHEPAAAPVARAQTRNTEARKANKEAREISKRIQAALEQAKITLAMGDSTCLTLAVVAIAQGKSDKNRARKLCEERDEAVEQTDEADEETDVAIEELRRSVEAMKVFVEGAKL